MSRINAPKSLAIALVTLCLAPLQLLALADTPLEGNWSGKSGPMADIPVTLKVKGPDILLEISLPSGHKFPIRGQLVIDPANKTIDITKIKGPDSEPIPDQKGLYKLDQQTLTICLGGPGSPRPAKFEDTSASGGSLMTLKPLQSK